MTRADFAFVLMIAVACAAQDQNVPARLTFEAASIRLALPDAPRVRMSGGPGTPDPGRVDFENVPLSNVLLQAFDLKQYQLVAPDWIDTERFDISAKIPQGATKAQYRLMLQDLLAQRFGLVSHSEVRNMPVFELLVGKNGHKMRDAVEFPTDSESSAPVKKGSDVPKTKVDQNGFPVLSAGSGPGMVIAGGRARLQLGKETMPQFANLLANQVGRPVFDRTGLTGKYAFSLFWVTDSALPSAESGPNRPAIPESDSGPNLFVALQEQIGLQLVQRKGLVNIIVIDRITRTPTEN